MKMSTPIKPCIGVETIRMISAPVDLPKGREVPTAKVEVEVWGRATEAVDEAGDLIGPSL